MAEPYTNQANPEFNKQVREYDEAILALALLFLDGDITRRVFTQRHIAITEQVLISSIVASGGVLSSPNVIEYLRKQQAITLTSTRQLADDIEAGKFSEQVNNEDVVTKTTELGAEQLATRLLLWGFTMGAAYSVGQLTKPDIIVRLPTGTLATVEPHFRWRLGATEKHCVDCSSASVEGIQSRTFWDNLAAIGIQPQSQALECSGYRCDCNLDEVPVESLINVGILEA